MQRAFYIKKMFKRLDEDRFFGVASSRVNWRLVWVDQT